MAKNEGVLVAYEVDGRQRGAEKFPKNFLNTLNLPTESWSRAGVISL